MNKYLLTGAVALMTSPAFAGNPDMYIPMQDVPEMSAGPAIAAIALLIGAAAIIREKSKRK